MALPPCRPLSAVFILLLLTGVLYAGQDAPPEARFDRAKLVEVPQAMVRMESQGEIAGAVTLVAMRDRVVQIEATGNANIAKGEPMKDDSLFWIASMTKPVTATAILMLQDEAKLSVDDPVAKYVPELGDLKTPSGKPANLTLKQLLTHTSGMLLEAENDQRVGCRTLADLMPIYAHSPMRFEPGTKWEYCQAGINTLGHVVEVVSGKSLPDFCRERIFGPLGMKDTTWYPTEAQAARLAMGYKRVDGKLVEHPFTFVGERPVTSHDHYPAANGGLFSTAADYGRFCQMLLNDGSLEGREYLRAQTVKQMRTIQTGDLKTGFTPGDAWGLGVCIVRQPQGVTAMLSPGTFGHGGAWGTQAWIDRVKGVVYVLMVQRADFPNSDASPVRLAFQQAAAAALMQ